MYSYLPVPTADRWLTNDKRKMPVMMKSSVKIGPIKATLIGFDQSQI